MNELMKIRDVSIKYDLSARTLRYYEDMGLITSIRSDDYAYRLYDDAAVARLEQILILRKLNISIKDIQRIFNTSGSEVVLEVLSKKVDAIDEEVSLLHELKEIVLDFIRQIEQADFGKESDVKLLYEKAKEIESQIVNVDYDGNPSTVNRLLEVTEKLENNPNIINKKSNFYMMFHVSDPTEAYTLYEKAFGAEKTSVDVLPNGDVYLNMHLNGCGILLRPSEPDKKYVIKSITYPCAEGSLVCCINFASEDELRHAYEVLSKNGSNYSIHTDAHWTPLCANVTDQYGVGWFFCV